MDARLDRDMLVRKLLEEDGVEVLRSGVRVLGQAVTAGSTCSRAWRPLVSRLDPGYLVRSITALLPAAASDMPVAS